MKITWILLLILASQEIIAQKQWQGFEIMEKPAAKRVDILYKGRLLTAYRYDDSLFKPVLFPVNTVDGITVTRGYPLEPRLGDRTDHPHHVGVWLNYEAVNGLDFWNNSTAIEPARRVHYGTIRHTAVVSKIAHEQTATLVVAAKWVNHAGILLLTEKTTYQFMVSGKDFFIDRMTALTAGNDTVHFRDVKDGLFAIRVARELEQPSSEKSAYIDEKGNRTEVPALPNSGITGKYYSSNGSSGDSVWSTKGTWVVLKGIKDKKKISIGIFDHPANPGYPAYWHARGYGLFSVNPLGRAIFSNGRESLNLVLDPGKSVDFRYKLMIASDHDVLPADMEKISKGFN